MEMELPRAQYSQEFREQSVKFFKESGLTLVEAAKRLSLPKGTLKNWVYADKRGELALVGRAYSEIQRSDMRWQVRILV
jgi:transposase